MHQAKLSSKNKIVLPPEVRKALHIKPGDRVLVVVRGSMAILLPKPENHADAILGIARDLYRENHLGMEGES